MWAKLASVSCLNHVWITGRIAPKYPVGFDRISRSEWTEMTGRIAPKRAIKSRKQCRDEMLNGHSALKHVGRELLIVIFDDHA